MKNFCQTHYEAHADRGLCTVRSSLAAIQYADLRNTDLGKCAGSTLSDYEDSYCDRPSEIRQLQGVKGNIKLKYQT